MERLLQVQKMTNLAAGDKAISMIAMIRDITRVIPEPAHLSPKLASMATQLPDLQKALREVKKHAALGGSRKQRKRLAKAAWKMVQILADRLLRKKHRRSRRGNQIPGSKGNPIRVVG